MRRMTAPLAVAAAMLLLTGCWPGGRGDGTTTRLTAEATAFGGGAVDPAALESARKTVARRLADAGFDDVDVTVPDPGTLEVHVSGGHGADELSGYLAPGALSLQLIRDVTPMSASAPAAAAADVAALSAGERFDRADVTCEQLDAIGPLNHGSPAVACDSAGTNKYLLDTAYVRNRDIKDATSQRDKQTDAWQVLISFTSAGQDNWTELTRQASTNPGACQPRARDEGDHCAVGIVVDGRVVSAPYVLAVIAGDAIITGDFTEAITKRLAATLRSGTIDVSLRVTDVQAG